jgi:hypothetical protein
MNTENHSLLLITVAHAHSTFLSQVAPASLIYTAEHRVEGCDPIEQNVDHLKLKKKKCCCLLYMILDLK